MCVYIGIEDLVANAFIELVEKSQKKEVLFSQISNYGATVVKILSAEGKKAVLVLSEEKTNVFYMIILNILSCLIQMKVKAFD